MGPYVGLHHRDRQRGGALLRSLSRVVQRLWTINPIPTSLRCMLRNSSRCSFVAFGTAIRRARARLTCVSPLMQSSPEDQLMSQISGELVDVTALRRIG